MRKKLDKNKGNALWALGAIAGATAVATMIVKKNKNKNKDLEENEILTYSDINDDREVYFVGGGLASLAGAAYLVRDCLPWR